MRRKAFLAVLIFLVLVSGLADAGMPFRKNRGGTKGGMFPDTGDIEDLVRIGKARSYEGASFQELYGAAGNRYIQYGLLEMTSCDYEYGGKDRRVSLEIATMDSPTAAAGLFHHHRGKVVQNKGESVEVGAEGLLDVPRGRRNLYFYRSKYFVKIVYSGKDPVPSLLDIGEYVDSHLPAGRDERPAGFEYIEIEGINKDTISLTPGFTFNISFLPASVRASAPGGGSPASDLHIITKYSNNEAAELHKDYTAYLKLHAEYVEEYTRGRLKLTKGVDPNQGRVVFAAYKNVFIIAARPDGYEKGEVLIERVIEKIDGESPMAEDSESSDGEKKGRRWNPFRRRK